MTEIPHVSVIRGEVRFRWVGPSVTIDGDSLIAWIRELAASGILPRVPLLVDRIEFERPWLGRYILASQSSEEVTIRYQGLHFLREQPDRLFYIINGERVEIDDPARK